MGKKGDLMRMAQDKVHDDGYVYKKGKSRAKQSSCSSIPESSKRTKIDTKEREMRISDIQEQIADIDKRIAYKQCRIETATVTRNVKTCDKLSEEISELKSQRRELNHELGPLQKKSKRSSWYFQKKIAKQKAPQGTASTDPQSSRDSSEPVEENDPVTDDEQSGLDDDKESGMNDDVVCLNP